LKKEKHFTNPIVPGFYPDPSVCRVGEDFYLVNSTFNYFPGIPVSHSKDLVNWRQIGNVIERPEQLNRKGIGHSRGIFAPSIRYHQGLFYVLCTHIDGGGNFVATAENPAGPWSDPVWLKDAPGIDPSIFFDEDGTAWYCGTRPAPEGEAYSGNWEVWVQQLDLETLQLTGESFGIWRGALRDVIWPEGPHIYKIGNFYYLMIAEGGTGMDHAITIARSKSLRGPWIGKSTNPILTHRHLGWNTPIVNVGHGDLVDDTAGNWWLVMLASRPYGGRSYNLGRETFMVPVRWEDEWPWPSPETGMVEEQFPFPDLKEVPQIPVPSCEHFDDDRLPLHWLSLQTDRGLERNFERPGFLRLGMQDPPLSNNGLSGFVGRRQQHKNWFLSCRMEFLPQKGEQAGIALMQNSNFHYRLEAALDKDTPVVRLVKREDGQEEIIAQQPCALLSEEIPSVLLAVQAVEQRLDFYFGSSLHKLQLLADCQEGRILSTERAGGFVGNVLGLFAFSEEEDSGNTADFDWMEYQGN